MIEEAQETSVSFWEMLINEWVFGMQGKDMEQIVRRKINATREAMEIAKQDKLFKKTEC